MEKILIVDDKVGMRESIKSALASGGYTDIVETADGAEAVTQYEQTHPDLVIMDIAMPGMNGVEALKAILEKDRSAKVVMCAAMGQEQLVLDSKCTGAKDFLVKPFRPERLLEVVRTVLAKG